MSALSRFNITSNGRKIMTSSLFLSIAIAGSAADHTAQAAPSSARSHLTSTTLSEEMLEAQVATANLAVEDLHARLVKSQKVVDRYQEVLTGLARTVLTLEKLFGSENDEMTAQEKILAGRRIIANNLEIARRIRPLDLSADASTTVAPPKDKLAFEIGRLGVRSDLQQTLKTYEAQVAYLMAALDQIDTETRYYNDEFSNIDRALSNVFEASSNDINAMVQTLSAFTDAKIWEKEFDEEMASTADEAFTISDSISPAK